MHNATADAAQPARSRLDEVRATDEEGAQAVEYAMIAGLGAGVIGLAWTAISGSGLLGRLVKVLLEALVVLVSEWF